MQERKCRHWHGIGLHPIEQGVAREPGIRTCEVVERRKILLRVLDSAWEIGALPVHRPFVRN